MMATTGAGEQYWACRGDMMRNLSPLMADLLGNLFTVGRVWMTIDRLDAQILELFAAEPRVGVLEAARRIGVARNTIQARLDRMQRSGVIADLAPTVDPAALGFPVTAFVTVEIAQGRGRRDVVDHLASIPEVIEVHTITGAADLLAQVVSRDNADLQRVIDDVVRDPAVVRASTSIALDTPVRHRTGPLVRSVGGLTA